MDIDCVVNEVILSSHWIQDIKDSNIGTEKFFNSVKIVTIRQSRSYDIDIDVDKHVKLTNEYFKNLNTINLKLVKPVSVDELSKILLINQKN